MNRPPSHWADSDLAEPLMRVLDSAESHDTDDAALEDMCARLETSLGAAFDARPAGPAPWHISPSQLRSYLTISVATIAAVSIPWWNLELQPAPSLAEVSRAPALQPTATAVGPVTQSPLHQELAPDRLTGPIEAATPAHHQREREPARAAQSRKHRSARVPASPGLAEELDGLAQIRVLLETSPQRALAAADEQQQRFARGALAPERELLRLDALLRMGQAKTLAAQLLAEPENHAYRARITELGALKRR